MTTTDLARRPNTTVATTTRTPKPATRGRRVGFFDVLVAALILAFLAGLFLSLAQQS